MLNKTDLVSPEQLDEVEAARKDAVAKMQDMRTEVRRWQAATRQAERERDHASGSAATQQHIRQEPPPGNSGRAARFDAIIDTALEIDSV